MLLLLSHLNELKYFLIADLTWKLKLNIRQMVRGQVNNLVGPTLEYCTLPEAFFFTVQIV